MKFSYDSTEYKILRAIGYSFFKTELEKLNEDEFTEDKVSVAVNEATKEIHNIYIHDIKTNEQDCPENASLDIIVYCERPGLLIGVKGSIMETVVKKIEEELKREVTVHISESNLGSALYSFQAVLNEY